jgi:class 3 adenylate cyclase
MTVATPEMVIMFADISGSTQIYETLGDVTARQEMAACIDLITRHVEENHGTVIKTIGDEVMSTFTDTEDAVLAACAIHDAFEDKEIPRPDVGDQADGGVFDLSVRIGLHFGPALLEEGDVFGDAVNVAARMVALAKPGQILTTEVTVAQLSTALRGSTRRIDRAAIKGKKDIVDIYEVTWHDTEVTGMAVGVKREIAAPPVPTATLYLRYHDQTLSLDDYHCFIVLGRGKQCDLAIDDEFTSRHHLRIECRKGKFYAIDQSTNGTFVGPGDGESSFLRRDEMMLSGCGLISLGRPFDDEKSQFVQFEIRDHAAPAPES